MFQQKLLFMKVDNDKIDFERLTHTEKEVLLEWAKKVKSIQQNKSLNMQVKIKELRTLNNSKAFNSCTKLITAYSKKYWKSASWAERMGIIGGVGALTLFGFGGAGVAALGGAIGVPLFLLTAAGGTLIGTIIDKLENKNQK